MPSCLAWHQVINATRWNEDHIARKPSYPVRFWVNLPAAGEGRAICTGDIFVFQVWREQILLNIGAFQILHSYPHPEIPTMHCHGCMVWQHLIDRFAESYSMPLMENALWKPPQAVQPDIRLLQSSRIIILRDSFPNPPGRKCSQSPDAQAAISSCQKKSRSIRCHGDAAQPDAETIVDCAQTSFSWLTIGQIHSAPDDWWGILKKTTPKFQLAVAILAFVGDAKKAVLCPSGQWNTSRWIWPLQNRLGWYPALLEWVKFRFRLIVAILIWLFCSTSLLAAPQKLTRMWYPYFWTKFWSCFGSQVQLIARRIREMEHYVAKSFLTISLS